MEIQKKPSKIDLAVLLIFFNRPQCFEKVFEQVKIARPSKLYLYQDGPREGNVRDIKNVKKCREIVSDIDWECEVHTLFQEKNIGCDPSGYLSQQWMFETEEMGMILEDDIVPSQSFFPFCKHLLEKYKDDKRIYCIAGMNHLGKYRDDYSDYIFSNFQSIWGWATWQRCIKGRSTQMEYLDDPYALEQLYQKFPKNLIKSKEHTCRWHRDSGKEYFESIGWTYQNCNNMLNIIPTKNLITNIGLGADGTHGGNSIKEYPKAWQKLFYAKRYELKNTLRHPSFVIEDYTYDKKLRKLTCDGHPFVGFIRSMNSACRRFGLCSSSERKEKLKRLPKTLKLIIKR